MYPPNLERSTWRTSSFSAENGTCVEVAWRKSSFSVENGTCVEVALADSLVGVRDSKNIGAGQLALDPAGWSALVGAVKGDQLTH